MWIYHNEQLIEPPLSAIGFVYIITNELNGMRYVGRKLLTKAAYKQVNGVKKKIRKSSDWEDYYSSSPTLLADVEKFGKENFKREILVFCNSKSALNYTEEKLQFEFGVLESHLWYNNNIRAKIFKKNIIGKVADTKQIVERFKN